jgi:C_GCAxxG_C_C family probable redox protein
LLAVSKATGRNDACLPRIATALGGGVAGQGEVCGALMGGILGIGLAYGRDHADDSAAKTTANAKATAFYRRFQEMNTSVLCRDIVEAGKQAGHEEDLHATVCTGAVTSAVRVFMDLYAAGKAE